MASFLTDLFSSIFTPGPSASLITATNVSFAALQIVLSLLLTATYSVHFLILSFLSAFLWYAINWFVRELEATTRDEKEAGRSGELRAAHLNDSQEEDSGEETEGAEERKKKNGTRRSKEASINSLSPDNSHGGLRNRRSLGEQSSGDLSTDSEWDKVGDSEGDISGRSSQD